MRSAKTQISLGIRPVWSESSLSAWRKPVSLAIHWAHSEDSDQTGRMPRLIWVFAERTVSLLVFVMRRLNWPGYRKLTEWHAPSDDLDQHLPNALWVASDPQPFDANNDQHAMMRRLIVIKHHNNQGQFEPRHAKTNKLNVRPAKSSLWAQWVGKDPSFLHVDSEDSYQTRRMPRLIWVFAGHTAILLVLSCRGSCRGCAGP